MLVISQIQEIRNNLSRLLGKVTVTDGTNDMPAMDSADRPGFQQSVEMPLAFRIDWAGDAVCYAGWAEPGTSGGSAGWRIKKIALSGDDVTVTWADGDADFDNVWDNRDSLDYS